MRPRSPLPSLVHVAVIGGGFSGTMAAIHLLRNNHCRVTLIERRDRVAAGAAYSTQEPAHLLNVRAANMSAFADAPSHFADWLERATGQPADSYAERRLYGRYLAELLAAQSPDERLTILHDEAVALEKNSGGLTVTLSSGSDLHCDCVIVASGNVATNRPSFPLQSRRLVENPWSEDGQEALREIAEKQGDVMLLGTGLTMVDMCLSLRTRGFAGRIIATSRRGLAPLAHQAFTPAPLAAAPAPRLSDLLRQTRNRAESHGWRAAVDALRPHSAALWQGFSIEEQRRFLRHLRPYWDVHRHRIAPAVAGMLDDLSLKGSLEIVAGRIAHIHDDGSSLDVSIAHRGDGRSVDRRVEALINCTGLAADIGATTDPLLRQMIDSGMARPDRLRLGLDVDPFSRVTDGDGTPHDNVFAIGPITRGRFWEIVAVPDIREQISLLTARIADAAAPCLEAEPS
ncbi:FAD-dependent oxidoreductase [Sphingosinicella humi]|uniref:FAD-dependent oxidoreductase n=1 Tax=Allosphingosinicella humi TaxID=2068657 RepID=A0A2U2J4Y2_9SPHN|nr:FAD-dependent oxidoreductase [Sphingosinicella humi]